MKIDFENVVGGIGLIALSVVSAILLKDGTAALIMFPIGIMCVVSNVRKKGG